MKNFILLLSTLVISSLTGCTFYRVNADEIAFNSVHPKENHKDIQYLETVTVPYEVIGTVVVGTERRNSIEEVVEKMKGQIAILGGDAVTNIVQFDEPSPITRIRTRYKGTVIVFKGPAQAENQAQPVSQNSSSGDNLK
jgi:hypothetical protein